MIGIGFVQWCYQTMESDGSLLTEMTDVCWLELQSDLAVAIRSNIVDFFLITQIRASDME